MPTYIIHRTQEYRVVADSLEEAHDLVEDDPGEHFVESHGFRYVDTLYADDEIRFDIRLLLDQVREIPDQPTPYHTSRALEHLIKIKKLYQRSDLTALEVRELREAHFALMVKAFGIPEDDVRRIWADEFEETTDAQ